MSTTLFDLNEPYLLYAAVSIILCPLIWNILARLEYKTHILTKLACGSPLLGCYGITVYIFSTSSLRDYIYDIAMDRQPKWALLDSPAVMAVAGLLMVVGSILVMSSFYQLGITGTYLGDYFGILMDAPVTAFPFNVTNNPMYNGSTMIFVGRALWKQSASGLVLSVLAYIVYQVALKFEEPFTAYIYANRDKKASTASPMKKRKSAKMD